MDHYAGKLENNEALDFTSGKKYREESPVLDLSCKKQSSSCIMSPLSIESSPPLMDNPCDDNSHNDIINYGATERKSPFEGRTFMVTPPSETDSPKKQKYEAMYGDVKVLTSMHSSDSMNLRYPLMPTSLPIPAILPIAIGRPSVVQPLTPQLPVSSTSSSSSVTPTPSISHDATSSPMSPETGKKAPRPFKAYPKDPLSLSVGNGAELMYDQNSNEAYSEFRKRMLDSVRRTNEGTNIKMRRISKSPGLPTSTMDDKDSAYWERRRKNNEAAKRSRDARRAKEDEIAIRAAFLEQENMKLKYELVALRNETAKLRCMVYTN